MTNANDDIRKAHKLLEDDDFWVDEDLERDIEKDDE